MTPSGSSGGLCRPRNSSTTTLKTRIIPFSLPRSQPVCYPFTSMEAQAIHDQNQGHDAMLGHRHTAIGNLFQIAAKPTHSQRAKPASEEVLQVYPNRMESRPLFFTLKLLSWLAVRTEMAASLVDNDASHQCLASAALFPFSAVNSQFLLIAACLTICVVVASKAGPSVLEPAFEDFRNGSEEPLFLP
jgi:hypothetical protein